MRHHKISQADEGIFQSGHQELFDKNLDDTTPQSRSDLISQAFITNTAMGDPTNMPSPPAVNPSLNGTPMPSSELSGVNRTTDTGADVLASYDEGRFAALRKYAQMNLPPTAAKSTKPTGTPVPKATTPQLGSLGMQVRDAGTAQGIGAAQTHSNAFSGDMSAEAPGAANVNSASLFKPTSGPGAQPEAKKASLEVRDGYGHQEPSKYSIPADNGQNYSPHNNIDENTKSRTVAKAFNDLNSQPNADHLNEMGQASIGTIG